MTSRSWTWSNHGFEKCTCRYKTFLHVWLVSLCVCVFTFMDALHAFETRPSAEGSAILYARLTFTFWKLSMAFFFVSILGLKIAKPKIDMNLLSFLSLHRAKFQTHPSRNLQFEILSVFWKSLCGGVHQPPLSQHQRVHQQLGVLLRWNQSEWRSSKIWNSAVRCPAEMMKTYGLCRIDVVGLPFDRFVLLLWQLRNFITDTRRDCILVCKESEKFLKGLPLEREIWLWYSFPLLVGPNGSKWCLLSPGITMSLTTMNTFHDTAPTTTSNLPTKGQIKNFDPTALIQTFRLEYEDADQHDHLNVLIEQTAAPEKKNCMKTKTGSFPHTPEFFHQSQHKAVFRSPSGSLAIQLSRLPHISAASSHGIHQLWRMLIQKLWSGHKKACLGGQNLLVKQPLQTLQGATWHQWQSC